MYDNRGIPIGGKNNPMIVVLVLLILGAVLYFFAVAIHGNPKVPTNYYYECDKYLGNLKEYTACTQLVDKINSNKIIQNQYNAPAYNK